VLAKDLVQLIGFTRNGVNKNTREQNLILFAKITAMKIAYFSMVIGAPIFVFGFSTGFTLGGFFLMHFVAGIVLTVVFQLAHTVEGTTHPLPNAEGIVENDWAIHQMNTTVNFSRDNAFLCWYLGGLNYQVEHHLFPKICHVHYPEISRIVEQTAHEFGVPYLENKSFGTALGSHIRYLKELGQIANWNEAIG